MPSRGFTMVLLPLLCFAGCSQSPPVQCTTELIGKERFVFELPGTITNHYQYDWSAYKSFRSASSWGQLWILEPKAPEDNPMLLLGADGKFSIECPNFFACDSLLVIRGQSKTDPLLVVQARAYRREPMFLMIAAPTSGKLCLLQKIGGEEWRTADLLNICVSSSVITISGLDPVRYSINADLTDFINKMGLRLEFRP